MQIRGLTSSSAESFLLRRLPSAARTQLLILGLQGTKNQNGPLMPLLPCPIKFADPPAASVKNSKVQAGNLSGAWIETTPLVDFIITHQKWSCLRSSAVMGTHSKRSEDVPWAFISSEMLNFPHGIKGA